MRTLLVTVPIGLLLMGCAQVPKPSTYTFSYQRKMQAAHHWDILAQNIAQRVVEEQGAMGEGGIYVQAGKGVFGATFSSLVQTELMNSGVVLAAAPLGAAVLDVDVQLIRYHAKWPHRADRMHPGFWTASSAILRTAGNWTKNMLIPAGVAFDLLDGSSTTLTKHEIVITTSIQKNGVYVMRQSNIFYVNDADRGQYVDSALACPKTVEVVGQ
jgi:hypothetical protein